ncbi:MAG: hypothetical protein ACI86H_000262 [bacterium]|jgi:hypothetical protein
MQQVQDFILAQLGEKKRKILQSILIKARQLALSPIDTEQERLLNERDLLFEQLKKTDDAIDIQEAQKDYTLSQIKPEIYQKITFLLESIVNNDQQVISCWEDQKTKLSQEKNNLTKTRKFSGYLKNQ